MEYVFAALINIEDDIPINHHTTPHFFESVQRLEGNQMLELDF